ncbi:hypothetical protein GDO86_000117 [Hymenochirus boettgeri]|uniref:Large ribosomal subunit protein bL35m n=1 Tax=Hymenochirus boettgeri TaxID=247094 RepID=A0A8T2K9S1_9PIPI|nr:hypothetical protein GDO86_000117 [Hymenochirus boettgeri]KAG8453359.1 hypothetical protein GDO86_000117 [Hymenochirus boettgeri]
MAAPSARIGGVLRCSGALLRQLSGLSIHSEGSRTVLQRSLKTNIPYQIRNVSNLCAEFYLPSQGTRLSSSTKLQPAFGKPTSASNTSVLNRLTPLLPNILSQSVRPLTYFGVRGGKRKSVKSVPDRFLRLHCGLWVRRKAGYKKKLWKKTAARKKRLREHVICNKTQCKLLDKMTTSFWKRRNWYINDPYQKYHDRTNLRV